MGDFPGGPVIKTLPSNKRAQVQSLVGELRFHMPQVTKPMHHNQRRPR